MSAAPLPNAKVQFQDASGSPLVGGTVAYFVPGTLAPKRTWSDLAMSVPNTNPILLDGFGQASVFGLGSYRQIVKDAGGALVYDGVTQALPYGSADADALTAAVNTVLEQVGEVPSLLAGFVARAGSVMTGGLNQAVTDGPNPYPIVSGRAALNRFTLTDNVTAQGIKVHQFEFNYGFGGTGTKGGRDAVAIYATLSAPSDSDNTDKEYNALQTAAYAAVNDGGTLIAPAGNLFGGASLAQLNPAATHFANVTSWEFNTVLFDGSSADYVSGIQIAGLRASQGVTTDAMVALSDLGSTALWRDGILFTHANGAYPVASGGTLFRTEAATVKRGIDLSAATFTDSPIVLPPLPSFAGDAAAGTAGVPTGGIYRVGQDIRVKLSPALVAQTINVESLYLATDPNYFAALNRAIIAANAASGQTEIQLPAGQFDISNLGTLTPISTSDVTIRGRGASTRLILNATGAAFQVGVDGGALVDNVRFQDLTLAYFTAATTASMIFDLRNCARGKFLDLKLEGFGKLAKLGNTMANRVQDSTFRVGGWKANIAAPVFQLCYGAGLQVDGATNLYVAGVASPPSWGTPTTVTAGCNVYDIVGNSWDTVLQGDGVLFQKFDRVLNAQPGAGNVLYGVQLGEGIYDVCGLPIYIRALNGAVVTTCSFGGYIQGNNDCGIDISTDNTGGSLVDVLEIKNPRIFFCRNQAIRIGPGVKGYVSNPDIYGVNCVGASGTGAIEIAAGNQGFSVKGSGSINDLRAGIGATTRCDYGLKIGADADNYCHDIQCGGAVGSMLVAANTSGSVNRRIRSQPGSSYRGAQSGAAWTLPASGTPWVNTTPFVVEWAVNGGTSVNYQKNGVALAGFTAGSIRVPPGESFTAFYSSPPTNANAYIPND